MRLELKRGASAILSLLVASVPVVAFARPATMSFVRLSADQGLSQGAVMSVLQDRRGFLWVGTEDGLNRYDGSDLKHYVRDRNSPASLPSNWISALQEDEQGRVWIGTDGEGVVWRDESNGKFQRVRSASGQLLLDPHAQIRTLFLDAQQRLWIATRNAGLSVLNIAAGTVREYRRDLTDPDSISDDSVFSVAQDSSGQLWIGTGSGLDRLDPASSSIEHYGSRLQQLTGATTIKVYAVLSDSRGAIWAGTDRGLIRLDIAGPSLRLFKQSKEEESLPSNRVTALLEDDERRLWVGTSSGLALLDRRSEKFTVFRNEPSDAASLPDDNIASLYQDRSGLLWVGTRTGGIARWNPRSWAFGHNQFPEHERNNITSFAVDSRGTLWLGTFGGGVAALDQQGNVLRRYAHGAPPPLELSDDNVMALVADDQDGIWLGTMGSGIERIDQRGGRPRRFTHDPNDPHTLPAPGVMALLKGASGSIWVGTYGGGLARIDPLQDRAYRYPISPDGGTGLSSDRATALAEDPRGLLWIGTDGGGLNVLDPATGAFRRFLHDPNDPFSLSSNTVYALHVDEHGKLWVGTRGGGLDCLTTDPFAGGSAKFKNISEADGLPNSTVYGIEADSVGKLWLSTNRGIVAYDPDGRGIRSFRRSHGLQGDEFNFGAHYRSPDGTLYFGGPNGYNAFMPERLRFNSRPPPVAFTDILKLNTPISATPYDVTDVNLGFGDNVLTLRFAALDFTGPRENRYQYRLEGFNDRWVEAGNLGQATYTNLNGGRYVFRVRAANSDGVWNEDGLSLAIRVAPPPWETWWARTLYATGFFLSVFAVWYSQKRHTKREAAYAQRLRVEVDTQTRQLSENYAELEAVNRQLREASLTDPMTGLGNRRCLREALQNLKQTTEAAASVLLIVDLDHLKPINDDHGHDAGDVVLVRVAEILRHLFRSSDLIVRWGGDEFVVLCNNCDLSMASTMAERLRSAIAKTIFRVSDGTLARISCSIGFASLPFIPQHPELLDWEQSINLADAALYRAKQGRNSWFGWGGTAAAAAVPSLLAAIDADAAALERDGALDVRRRAADAADTVDQLRALGRLDSR